METTTRMFDDPKREYECSQDMHAGSIVVRRQCCLCMCVIFSNIGRDRVKVQQWLTLHGRAWDIGAMKALTPNSTMSTASMARTIKDAKRFYEEVVEPKTVVGEVTKKMILKTIASTLDLHESHLTLTSVFLNRISEEDSILHADIVK